MLRELNPAVRLVQGIGSVFPQFCFNRLRTALWRAVDVQIGADSLVMGDLILSGEGDWASLLSIGNHTYITGPLRIELGASVHIGNTVNIGHDCNFLTIAREAAPHTRRPGTGAYGSIVVEDGCWLASRVTVMPGVTIGRGSVVATGAVVTSDVPPNTLVGGVPAKLLRELGS